MNIKLLTGLDEGEKQLVQAEWLNSKLLRKNISKVLTSELERSIINQEGMEFIKNPNLLVAYAAEDGYRRGIRYVLNLIQQDSE